MNWYDHHARYFDPEVGRWWAIDPALQGASPYMAMGNNPMVYIDENGEIFGVDDLIAGVLGGAINLTVNILQGNIDNVGEGLASFGAGFAAGALATYGPVGWAAGGAILGAVNSATSQMTSWSQFSQIDFGQVVTESALGAVSSVAGGYAGQFASKLSFVAVNGIASPVLRGTIGGVLGGIGGAYAGGFTVGLITTGDLQQAHKMGMSGIKSGAITGGITGTVAGFRYARNNNLDLWTGKSKIQDLVKYYPENDGALGEWQAEHLLPGDKIDRYGSTAGKYFSPEGTPLDMRALPPDANTNNYNVYEVMKPFSVKSSTIAPAFGKIGLGKQYYSPVTTEILLQKGIIRKVN